MREDCLYQDISPRNTQNFKMYTNKEKSANHRILAVGGGGGVAGLKSSKI